MLLYLIYDFVGDKLIFFFKNSEKIRRSCFACSSPVFEKITLLSM